MKLENFKKEISKYESIHHEIEAKYDNVLQILQGNSMEEFGCYNHMNMIYEDLLSFNNEIIILTNHVNQLRENMNDIEKTYPKEFKFLLEDVGLEKELNEMSTKRMSIKKDLDILHKSKKELHLLQETKLAQVKTNEDDIKRNETSIQSARNESVVLKLEEYVINNISDLFLFEKIKVILQNYYSQKNFDVENEVNVILIKNLNGKLKEMKNEFVLIKNEKTLQKSKIEKKLEELRKVLNGVGSGKPPSSLTKEITSTEIEIDEISNEINMLELNCKKKETLFNKYIFVIRNKCKKSTQESYYEMNPALIIETEFDDKLKEEILRQIDAESKSEEERIKNRNVIDIYFKELNNRERNIQNAILRKKKLEDANESLEKEIEKIGDQLTSIQNEINNKNISLNTIQTKEKILYEKIEMRNRNLTANLEQLSELDFEKYLHSNEQILKNMKRIYGGKIIDKVFKVQKQKFLESVVMDHSFKKTKVNEYIQTITKYEQSMELYTSSINQLETNYQTMLTKYQSIIDFGRTKANENKILEESKTELKNKMELILQGQLKDIELEKKQLKFKFNVNFLIDKVKEINKRLENLQKEKERLTQEYEEFNNLIIEKEHRLYKEDLDLKNNLVSLEPSRTVMPYKVYKSFNEEPSSEVEFSPKPNFEETIKKSLIEFTSPYEDIHELKQNYDLDHSTTSYRTMHSKGQQDPLIQHAVEKIKPLKVGIAMYKRFGNSSSVNTKAYEQGMNPENCGYAQRIFKISPNEEVIEIRNPKNRHLEQKLHINQLKGILLSTASKQVIKSKKNLSSKPNGEISKLINTDYIQFTILITEGNLDVITPSYQAFRTVEGAVNELITNRRNLYTILKLLENNN